MTDKEVSLSYKEHELVQLENLHERTYNFKERHKLMFEICVLESEITALRDEINDERGRAPTVN